MQHLAEMSLGHSSLQGPILDNNYGTYLGPSGLLIGNANNNKYLLVTHDGNIYAPGFSIVNGNATFGGKLTANAIDAVSTINIGKEMITIPRAAEQVGTAILGVYEPITKKILNFDLDAGGQPIWIFASASLQSFSVADQGENPGPAANYYTYITLKVDGTTTGVTNMAGITALIKGGGNHTIELWANGHWGSNSYSGALSVSSGSLFAIGAKR